MPFSRQKSALAILFAISALMLSAAASGAQDEARTPAARAARQTPEPHGPQLAGDRVTLPLVLINGFPFVEGAINGKRGKLLFDIGETEALTVDSHTVPASGGIPTGHGFFGSGEKFDVVSFPTIRSLSLPGELRYADMTNIQGNPGLPLEQQITPDFIGWLGVHFFAGYVARIDYAAPSVTFFRDDASGSGEKAALAGEHVLYTIPLSTKDRYGLVNFQAQVGSLKVLGSLDTGSANTMWLEHGQLTNLLRDGTLTVHHEPGDKEDHYTLHDLVVDGHPMPPMPVDITNGAPPMLKVMTRHDLPVLMLGYEFLKQFRIVLDYDGRTLALLSLKQRT